MNAFTADYFDGRTSARQGVEVTVEGGQARLRGPSVALDFPLAALDVSPRLGNTPLRITLPDGGLLVTGEYERVAALLGVAPARSAAHRLESRPGIVVAALAGLVIACAILYVTAIPWTARIVAERLPADIDAGIATEGLQGLDRYVFKPSALDGRERARVAGEFEGLARVSGLHGVRLEFRDGNWIGANAFALPGGVVIVTDQLVDLLGDEKKVAAVLAHELGHVRHRHTTRHILQDSMTALLSMVLLGDASSAMGVASAMPALLAHTGYSRDFEREADAFAFDLLRRTGREPRLLGEALEQLAAEHQGRKGERDRTERAISYISTHPPTQERVQAAEEASR